MRIRHKVLIEYIYEQYIFIKETFVEKGIQRELDQSKRPLRLRVAVLIGGAGFICRISGKEWPVKVAHKVESGFTIKGVGSFLTPPRFEPSSFRFSGLKT